MNRWKDWWDQGERDVRHAGHALEDADYEWSAFAAQQGAEKALKALILTRGGEPWGHSVTGLAEALPPDIEAPPGLIEAAGYPGKLYTRGEAEGAIADAQEILEFCRRHLP